MFLLISKVTTCQESPLPPTFYTKTKFSLIAGPSLLSVRENESFSQYGVPKIGFSAGLGVVKSITSNLQFQGKILFERKGYKTSTPDTLNTSNGRVFGRSIYNYSFDYLTFSIVPQLLLGKRKAIGIGAGFYLGRLLRAKFQVINTTLNSNSSRLLPTDRSRKLDYGATLNLSYHLFLAKKFNIAFQLTWNYGFKQIAPPPPFPKEKNSSIVLTVGISKKK